MRKDEREIERWMRDKIQDMGGLFLKWVSPGNDGVPDRIVILPGGRVYFLELKADDGRLSGIQKWWNIRLWRLGCDARVIVGMEEAKAFITEARREVMRNGACVARLSEESSGEDS